MLAPSRRAWLGVLAVTALAGPGCGSGPHSGGPAKRPAAIAGAPSKPARASQPAGCHRRPVEHLIQRPRWVDGVEITEYFSVPERWFSGVRVAAPGIPGRHRVDWLYSAHGVAMEGDGIGLDGRHYHIDALGDSGWINPAGRRTRASACASRWSRGLPSWLEGGWRNRAGAVTFPLDGGGWSNGPGVRHLSYAGVTFAPGSSIPLRPYRTVAVDPDLIPSGSRIYVPAYRAVNGGWFVASDTGGAIIGRHIDVYRPPTASIDDGGRYLTHERVYVKPPA
jgi:3D (Asp-Asp-Asp) domain-containing protein